MPLTAIFLSIYLTIEKNQNFSCVTTKQTNQVDIRLVDTVYRTGSYEEDKNNASSSRKDRGK